MYHAIHKILAIGKRSRSFGHSLPPIYKIPSSSFSHLKSQHQTNQSSFNIEVESPVSAARFFKATVLDWHKLGPQLMPQFIASVKFVQGEGAAVGSVRQFNLAPGMPFSYMKDRLDLIDHDKLEMKTTIVEEGPIVAADHEGTKLGSETANKTFHVKLEPTSSGGCIYKVFVTSKTIGEDHEVMQAQTKEALIGEVKAVEAYLLANPTAYS